MNNVEISPTFKTTSFSLPSPTATHSASLSGTRLHIRCLVSLEIVRNIPLPPSHDVRNSSLAWSPPCTPQITTPRRRTPAPRSNRILVADDETTRVYDLRDAKWNAVISNGSGGMGKNVHVEFGTSEEEVLVWSGFASKMTVWCLRTGRTVEIRDPKFEGRGKKGYGYKPAQTGTVGRGGRGGGRGGGGGGGGGVLAVLCRTAGQDILLLLAPRTYAVIRRIELTTVDAQGLKWSRDGRWIAIWDSAASGYGLCVYTADGHLYRTISRERSDEYNEWDVEGLGIKTVEWVPGDEWLAVGGWDRRVRILSTRTFSPAMYLDHTATIDVPGCPVYTEQVDDLKARTYKLTPQPTTPPKAPTEKSDATIIRQGISIVAFNSEGTMCATRDDSTPTTIWIWDLRSLKPRTVLIQHAAVKTFSWHPTDSSLLLIQAVQDAPTIYLYTTTSVASTSPSSIPGADAPAILDLSPKISKPAGSLPPKWDARWLPTAMDKKPALVFSHPQSYMLVYPEGKDTILRFDDAGEDSDDSLYDILTGRTPIPRLREDLDDGESDFEDDSGFQGVDADAGDIVGFEGDLPGYSTASFDDTFRERRNKVVNSKDRGESIFDESGMDEMF